MAEEETATFYHFVGTPTHVSGGLSDGEGSGDHDFLTQRDRQWHESDQLVSHDVQAEVHAAPAAPTKPQRLLTDHDKDQDRPKESKDSKSKAKSSKKSSSSKSSSLPPISLNITIIVIWLCFDLNLWI